MTNNTTTTLGALVTLDPAKLPAHHADLAERVFTVTAEPNADDEVTLGGWLVVPASWLQGTETMAPGAAYTRATVETRDTDPVAALGSYLAAGADPGIDY